MADDPFHLRRFIEAQNAPAGASRSVYDQALAELRAGAKTSHWIWFVLPQLAGLGRSQWSEFYGLSGLDEARAYLAHPLLGPRLRACIDAMLTHEDKSAADILGPLDARKFQSCLTLFARAAPGEALFARALARFFDGEQDERTLARIK